jgi:acyl carrier protein
MQTMERLYIRGRILSLFEKSCEIEEDAWQGEPAFSIDADDLSHLLADEFGVTLPPDRFPDLLTVNWLVDVVASLTHGDDLVM